MAKRNHTIEGVLRARLGNQIRDAARSQDVPRLRVLCNGQSQSQFRVRELQAMVKYNWPGTPEEQLDALEQVFGETANRCAF